MPTQSEIRRIIPFTLLLFCLCGPYCMLRATKDVITLTSYSCGAEVIPFLKVWGLLPASITLISLFAWLSRHIRRDKLFYLFVGGFLSYYLTFAYVFFPNLDAYRLEKVAVLLHHYLPAGLEGLIQIIENWPVTVFYVTAELWPTAMMAVLFWGFANQSFTNEEAKRSYGWVKIGATVSALFGGLLANMLTTHSAGGWEVTFYRQIHAICILGMICLVIFAYIQRTILPETRRPQAKETKEKRSLTHSLRVVMADKRLLCLAMMVIGYNMVYNCADVLWKAQLRLAYPDPNDLMRFISKLTAVVGTIAVTAAIGSGWIIRRLGWLPLAMATPAVMLVLSLSFFLVLFFGKSEGLTTAAMTAGAPATLLVSIGAAQNALSKACKYSVFDISKEIAFSSLDSETLWNGKTAIDGIGNDLGKTGASVSQQALLLGFGNLSFAAPWLAGLIFMVLLTWLFAVTTLGKSQRQHALAQEKA